MKNRLLFMTGALILPLIVGAARLLGYGMVNTVFSIVFVVYGACLCVLVGMLFRVMFGDQK